MTAPSDKEIDWNLCTWKGSRRRQHQEYHALPFGRKLELIEEMNEAARALIADRRRRGLPYFDPYRAAPAGSVAREEPTVPGINPESS